MNGDRIGEADGILLKTAHSPSADALIFRVIGVFVLDPHCFVDGIDVSADFNMDRMLGERGHFSE